MNFFFHLKNIVQNGFFLQFLFVPEVNKKSAPKVYFRISGISGIPYIHIRVQYLAAASYGSRHLLRIERSYTRLYMAV